VRADGVSLGSLSLRKKGPFRMVCRIPEDLRGREVELELRFNKTWRPGGGDYRQLAGIIDVIRSEGGS
ncbi:MAG: hypothetical protein HZB13_00490, partial [Acidobacteria bacterium]|nr:hypothetical protein [Acidobacteriota bacterium]